MQIQEEYIKRHNLSVSLIPYADPVNLFLTDGSRWRVLTAEWLHPSSHPGKYEFRYVQPVYNGHVKYYNNNRHFPAKWHWLFDYVNKDTFSDLVFWDQYDGYITDWIKNDLQGFRAIQSAKLARLVAFEMFLYTHDSYLACRMKPDFYVVVADCINKENDLNSRVEAYSYAYEFIERDSKACQSLNYHFLSHTFEYSHWLAEMINGSTC